MKKYIKIFVLLFITTLTIISVDPALAQNQSVLPISAQESTDVGPILSGNLWLISPLVLIALAIIFFWGANDSSEETPTTGTATTYHDIRNESENEKSEE